MTKKTNPFMDFDMFKAFDNWGDFNPAKAVEQFSKMTSNMNMPNVDVDAFVASQRKSVEALSEANQKVFDGVRAVTERQTKILHEAVEESASVFETLGQVKSPQEAVELSRKAYNKAVKDMSELSNMITKASVDAAAPVNARIKEGFDEVKLMASDNSK